MAGVPNYLGVVGGAVTEGAVTEGRFFKDPRGFEGEYKDDNKNSNGKSSIVYTILVILISLLIFVTVLAWLSVLQAYLDSIYIDELFWKTFKSRLIYAFILTAFSIFVVSLAILFMIRFEHLNIF